MTITPALLDRLRDIVGPTGYIDTPADLESFIVDHRKLYRGATPLLLRPDSTEQVSDILRICNEMTVGVVPIGGNTGYCGGATPSEDGSQIMLGGTAVLRYGMMRDLVLGLEVVLPDGRVLDGLQSLRKDNTGYDLRDLFIGAEGTLGIITAAACKLFSRPASLVTALTAVPNPQAAVSLLARLRAATGDAVATFELMPRIALELVTRHIQQASDPFEQVYPWYVLLEISSGRHDPGIRDAIEVELGAAMESGEILNAVLAQSDAQREMFWRLRENIPEAQRRDGGSIKHDISVTTTQLPSFMAEASELVRKLAPHGRIVAYGHLGDGNVHFNINQPLGGDTDSFYALAPQINEAVHDLVAKYGGSFSAEHGIGRLKRHELVRYKSPVAVALMRSIKNAVDPKGIMNPGKVL